MNEMQGRVVVITGASSGFGRGAARKFAENGAHVVLAARRRRLLRDLARECKELGAEALVLETDVSNADDVERLAEETLEKFGHIDVWINNAGVGAVARFEETPIKENEQVIRTNLLGTVYGSHAALRQFQKQGYGTLINVSSFAGKVAAPYLSSYSASKFGVRGLDMALRQELEQNHDDNIRVCTVMPVSMDTPFFEHAANHTGKPVQPIPPVYDPQKVVDTIYHMALEPQDEIVVGASGHVGSLGERLAPKLTEKQMGKKAHKVQMEQDESAPQKSGSVFKPMRTGTGLHSSGREEGNGSKLAAGLGLLVPVAMGAAFLVFNRIQERQEAAQKVREVQRMQQVEEHPAA